MTRSWRPTHGPSLRHASNSIESIVECFTTQEAPEGLVSAYLVGVDSRRVVHVDQLQARWRLVVPSRSASALSSTLNQLGSTPQSPLAIFPNYPRATFIWFGLCSHSALSNVILLSLCTITRSLVRSSDFPPMRYSLLLRL